MKTRSTYRPDHNGECLNCDEPLDGHLILCPDPGGSNLIDELEAAVQFARHRAESAETQLTIVTAERDFWRLQALNPK